MWSLLFFQDRRFLSTNFCDGLVPATCFAPHREQMLFWALQLTLLQYRDHWLSHDTKNTSPTALAAYSGVLCGQIPTESIEYQIVAKKCNWAFWHLVSLQKVICGLGTRLWGGTCTWLSRPMPSWKIVTTQHVELDCQYPGLQLHQGS